MPDDNEKFYLQLFKTKSNTYELRYSSGGEFFVVLFPITAEQALEMSSDGWPIVKEK